MSLAGAQGSPGFTFGETPESEPSKTDSGGGFDRFGRVLPGSATVRLGFLGMLFGTAIWLPVAVSIAAVVLYLTNNAILHSNAVAIALALTILLWVALAAFGSAGALPQNANSQVYAEIDLRLTEIRAIVSAERPGPDDPSEVHVAFAEARAALAQLDRMLTEPNAMDTRWVMATGYVDALRVLHRAEQAALMFAPVGFVTRIATDDAARLEGSDIDDRKALSAQLIAALRTISPDSAAALQGLSGPVATSDGRATRQ